MRVIAQELDLLAELVPLAGQNIIELGCGAAPLARQLLARHADSTVAALEVDERQMAKNLQSPQARLQFVCAGAQAIPFPEHSFDLALMLKSLHHVPLDLLATALSEVLRVLRPQGLLYVSEPVFAGALNEVMRLFHDEELVRTAALRALQAAVASDAWEQVAEVHFETPVHFASFEDFHRRMVGVTFQTHALDEATLARVRARFEPHLGPDGAHFSRPMRVNLLRRR